jgi:hypothetical protein
MNAATVARLVAVTARERIARRVEHLEGGSLRPLPSRYFVRTVTANTPPLPPLSTIKKA